MVKKEPNFQNNFGSFLFNDKYHIYLEDIGLN